MYVPDHFTVENPVWAHEIMRTHSFATLVSGATTKLTASHLPLLWTDSNQGNGVIQGHMARANPQWQDFTEDAEVMAIFTGHHAYISPNWYISRPAVPTWNYAAVHAYGVARVINDHASKPKPNSAKIAQPMIGHGSLLHFRTRTKQKRKHLPTSCTTKKLKKIYDHPIYQLIASAIGRK